MGAYHDPWPCAEHQEGLSYSSGADKTFSVVTREIVWSQAARSPPVQKGHAGCWKSRTKQKTIDLLKKQQTFNWWQDPWFVFLKLKSKCSLHHLGLTPEHLAKLVFVTWQKHDAQPCKMTVWSAFSVCSCGDAWKCQSPLTLLLLLPPATAEAVMRCLLAASCWERPTTPQAVQAPSASEVVWQRPSPGISKTVRPKRKVSSNTLRLLASVPETKNYTY